MTVFIDENSVSVLWNVSSTASVDVSGQPTGDTHTTPTCTQSGLLYAAAYSSHIVVGGDVNGIKYVGYRRRRSILKTNSNHMKHPVTGQRRKTPLAYPAHDER